jgi:hypothetical protein
MLSKEDLQQVTAEVLKQTGKSVSGSPVIGQPARIIQHKKIRCEQTGQVFDANHEDPVGETRKLGVRNPTFAGCDTEVVSVEALEPHHAAYHPELEQR